MIKAVIFDIDETLTERDSWTRLTDDLGGSADEHLRILKDFLEGRTSYEEAKAELIKLWRATGNANKQTFQRIFERWPLRKEAPGLINFLKERGFIICKISGSMDLYVETIAERLGISFYFFNAELIWDNEGNLVDFHYVKDQAGKKVEQFLGFCRKQELSPQECVVVGDGPNDIELFKVARGIALKSPNSKDLEPIAWKVVDSLSEIKQILVKDDQETKSLE